MIKVATSSDNTPRLSRNTVIKAIIRYRKVNDLERAQLYGFDRVRANEAIGFLNNLASLNKKTRKSIDDTEFYVESSVYDGLRDSMLEAAKKIRGEV